MDDRSPSESSSGRADVFVSYSHQDAEWARVLVDRLRKESVSNRPLRVLIDEEAFGLGRSLAQSIELGVRGAEKLICVLSPDFVGSDWTALEYEMKLLDDPAGRKGLILPIIYRTCDVPYALRVRIYADFRPPREFEQEYARLLVAIGVTPFPSAAPTEKTEAIRLPLGEGIPPSAQYPDNIAEKLALNLFEVTEIPATVWAAETPFESPSDLADAVRLPREFAFVIRDGRLWSFSRFDRIVKENADAFSTSKPRELSFTKLSSSVEHRNLAVELLNKELGQFLRGKGILHDRYYDRYYFPANGGKERVVTWPGLQKSAPRTVTVPRLKGGVIDRFDHHAVSMGFVEVSGRWYLEVLPTRTVTVDGIRPKRGRDVGPLVTRRIRGVYNNAFWLDVMFWLFQLQSQGGIRIGPRGRSICVSGTPLFVDVPRGIAGDHLALFEKDYVERWSDSAPSLEEGADSRIEEEPDLSNGGAEAP